MVELDVDGCVETSRSKWNINIGIIRTLPLLSDDGSICGITSSGSSSVHAVIIAPVPITKMKLKH